MSVVMELLFPVVFLPAVYTAGALTTPRAACSSAEFTCVSGECIGLTHRCDREYHCRDGSDEFDCRK